jgi:hypothetical protein
MGQWTQANGWMIRDDRRRPRLLQCYGYKSNVAWDKSRDLLAALPTPTADDRKETGPAKYSLILLLVSGITLFLSSIFTVSSVILPNAGAHSTYMFRW